MSIETALKDRSGSKCELCSRSADLTIYEVPPVEVPGVDSSLLLCQVCLSQIEDPDLVDVHHWRCLNDSMWGTIPAVQVMAWRMLTRLAGEGWPQGLLDMLYLDEETLAFARATGEGNIDLVVQKHADSNGVELLDGDTVTLVKDLNVKGGGFTAKRGTAVRNISLVQDNPDHIEGKVSGQQIILLTKYLKKSN